MSKFFRHFKYLSVIIGAFFLLHSCILKEFNFNENKLDTDWDMQLLVPLFYGDLEFKDLIYDWKSPVTYNTSEPTVELAFAPDSSITFPTSVFYEPATIIDAFSFLIEGDDYLSQAGFNYKVTNESHYPLFLQMRFFDKNSTAAQNPKIIAGPFPPLTDDYELQVQLNQEQLESFKAGNRIEFVSWFEGVPGFNPDTISARNPIQLSIVLSGVAHGYYQ